MCIYHITELAAKQSLVYAGTCKQQLCRHSEYRHPMRSNGGLLQLTLLGELEKSAIAECAWNHHHHLVELDKIKVLNEAPHYS